MKKNYIFLLLLLSLYACQSKSDKNEKKNVEQIHQEAEIPLDTMGAWVRLVMLSPQGVLRGFDLGTPLDSIKKNEKATLQEENKEKKYIAYTFDVDDDFVDIIYELDEQNKLKAVRVNAVVNGVESFLEDFRKFYELRYGRSKKIDAQNVVWQSKKGYQIKLSNTKGETKASIIIEKK
ncbi:MAG: hypothetical protein SFU27_09200 [Thermonemataceae bacterium]|nr:hypothetical protein [Thermonemataceae bacterium]